MSQFLHDDAAADDDDAKALAMLRVFSENSRAKNRLSKTDTINAS